MVLARSLHGITVDVGDQFSDEQHGERIHAVFFLVSPEDNPGQHLRLLAGIAGRADDDDFMDAWLASDDPADFREAVLRDERFMSLHLSEHGPSSGLVGAQLKHIRWPEGTLVALVRRGGAILVPSGGTTLRAGDRLSIVGDTEGIQAVRAQYGSIADLEIPDFISTETSLPAEADPLS